MHGGWRPWWAQGSSVTYIVAPLTSAPRCAASESALTSAWAWPRRSWNPSPITLPSAETITAPTIGFGLTEPRPRAASSSARRMCTPSWSVAT